MLRTVALSIAAVIGILAVSLLFTVADTNHQVAAANPPSTGSSSSRCQIDTSGGLTYDFNTPTLSADITSSTTYTNDGCTYTLNLCGNTSSACGAGVLACQTCSGSSTVRTLAYSSTLALAFVNASTPQLGVVATAQQYTTLNPCYRNVNVLLSCGADSTSFTQIESATDGAVCEHNFVVSTPVMCQFNKGRPNWALNQ